MEIQILILIFLIVVFLFGYSGFFDKIRIELAEWLAGEYSYQIESFQDLIKTIQQTTFKLPTLLYCLVWFIFGVIDCVSCASFWIVSISFWLIGWIGGWEFLEQCECYNGSFWMIGVFGLVVGGISFWMAQTVLQMMRIIDGIVMNTLNRITQWINKMI